MVKKKVTNKHSDGDHVKGQEKRPRGRPAGQSKYYEHFDHIPDTPENVAKALFSTPPKQDNEWEYLKEQSDSEE